MIVNMLPLSYVLTILLTFAILYATLVSVSVWLMDQMPHSCLVLNSTVVPAGKLQRRYHILNCHRSRVSRAKGILKFVHMDGNENLYDIVTRGRKSKTWLPLMKPLLLWHDMEFLKERVFAEGIRNRSSTPPPIS